MSERPSDTGPSPFDDTAPTDDTTPTGWTVPTPETVLVADALSAARHTGTAPSGITVVVTQAMEVVEIGVPARAWSLGPAEAGHEVLVATEYARRHAVATLTSRLAADHRFAAALRTRPVVGDGLGELAEERPLGTSSHLSPDGRIRVDRRDDGVITAVTLDLADGESVGEVTEPLRDVLTRALGDDGPGDRAAARGARTTAAMDRLLGQLGELEADLDDALRRD